MAVEKHRAPSSNEAPRARPSLAGEERLRVDHQSRLAAILRDQESRILAEWTSLLAKTSRGADRAETEEQARTFARLLAQAMAQDATGEIDGPAWAKMRDMLTGLSAARARQGSTPSETATFIFSFKEALFARLREEDPA